MSSDVGTGETTINVDDKQIPAIVGQSVAGALEAAGVRSWRTNMVDGTPRAPFCGMGVCYECELDVEGSAETRACMTDVKPGLVVSTEKACYGCF